VHLRPYDAPIDEEDFINQVAELLWNREQWRQCLVLTFGVFFAFARLAVTFTGSHPLILVHRALRFLIIDGHSGGTEFKDS